MSRRTRNRSAETIMLGVLAAVLALGPAAAAGRGMVVPATMPPARSADLAPALGADGTFRGAPGVTGSVDSHSWTLVSDLARGEPPRFAPAGVAAATPKGPWSALGSNGPGKGPLIGHPYAVAVSGANLYVGGLFRNAAGIATADYIARWNGSAWSALGSNGSGNGALNDLVYSLAVSGTDLYVGGDFINAAGIATADYVAKWNGSAWSALGSNGSGNGALNSRVFALAVSGSNVYVGGLFLDAAGIAEADHLAMWNGSAWSALGSGPGNRALNSNVLALAVLGGDLYAGGNFTNAAGIATADYVARWDGSAWSALGSNGSGDGALNKFVGALAVSGSDLYVGGNFTDVAGNPRADRVVAWNGSAWSALGSNGLGNGALNDQVRALAVSGSDLYVGGDFTDAAGIAAADYVARWDGVRWSTLGSNGSGDGALNALVFALGASRSDLYVGGDFADAAGIATADYVAKWAIIRRPDGRIRLGTGALVGNNIYNTAGGNQTRTGSATPGHTITFGISIQNDGDGSDRFTVKATGTPVAGYAVTYVRGTTDITAAVVAGTYQTPSLAPAATYLITARVSVTSTAPLGSSIARLLTISSVGNAARKDAVKLIGERR